MFEYNGAKITARELTIADDDALVGFYEPVAVNHPQASVLSVNRFAEFMQAAQIEGEPPIPMVTARSEAEVIGAAYEAWLKLPRWFAVSWRGELNDAESAAPKK